MRVEAQGGGGGKGLVHGFHINGTDRETHLPSVRLGAIPAVICAGFGSSFCRRTLGHGLRPFRLKRTGSDRMWSPIGVTLMCSRTLMNRSMLVSVPLIKMSLTIQDLNDHES